MNKPFYPNNVTRTRRQCCLSEAGILPIFFVAVALVGLISLVPLQAAGQLPPGPGWHVLPNTQMTPVCVGNVPNGMYSDNTMTTTTSYNFNCNEIIPWSGGAIDDAHQRLIVWGGGHSDYAGNEVFVLNLNGTPSWQLFTNPTIPVPYWADRNNWEGLSPYYVRLVDGGVYQPGAAPASRHTYNSLQYVPYQNKLYSFGGSVANVGFLSQEIWTLDMGSKTWTMVGPPFSKSPWYPTTAYNPSNGHIVMHDKNWSFFDYDPRTNTWATLTTSYHVEDGTTAAVDPVNNLAVFVGSAGTTGNTTYPSVPTSHTVQVLSLSAPYSMQSWNAAGCDLTYRSGGLAWDSALGLMVGYPGGGNQVYLLNTGPNTISTPYGAVQPHTCLDVPISLNPSPVKGVDYPPDPEGTSNGVNYGIYGRFEYVPSLDVFVVMNDHTQNVWILRLTGGSPAPDYTLSASPNSLTVLPGGAAATATISTAVLGGFNNSISLSAVGMPTDMSISFSPTTIAAPGAGTSTMTVSASTGTPNGTYPIVVTGFGGGDTHTTVIPVTVTTNGPPTLSVSTAPSSFILSRGSYGSSTITTTIGGSFNSAVSLRASNVPTGTAVTFDSSTIPAPGGGTSAMTINVGAATQPGTYPITVQATGGALSTTTTVNLTVMGWQPSNLTVSASPSSLALAQGTQGTSAITTTASGGLNSQVPLSATGAPSGTTVSFNPSTIPAPGSGTSTMTITVGATTPAGTYPITVTASGGELAPTTTVTLTVTNSPNWQQGFNFRSTAGYVNDPVNTTHVLATTTYPTTVNGVTFGWANTALVQSRDRNNLIDPRLAGINYVNNGNPASFYVDLPAPGTYNLSLAMGDDGYGQCWTQCQIQFFDGNTLLGTVSDGLEGQGFSYDATGKNWSATAWPGSNVPLPVTLSGTRLTVVVGTSNNTGDLTPMAFLGLTQTAAVPNFTLTANPSSLSVQQGNSGTSTITTTISGGFNSDITLSASGVPTGTTVSFAPNPITAPGAGSSTMTILVGNNTPTGTYPITVIGNGGSIEQQTMVMLTVTAPVQPDFSIAAQPNSLLIGQGNQGTSTISTTIVGGFNSPISLSATGVATGTTVSFAPNTIAAPGAGSSTMTVMVGANTALGTYPITVTGTGGSTQHSVTMTLTVTTAVWQQGFNFRATTGYVSDPVNTTYVLATTAYPTSVGGVTFGWQNTNLVQSRDRSTGVDPRLAGINYVSNGSPAIFYVDLPSAGSYNLSLAMGDEGYTQCWTMCQVQFLDGSTVVGTITGNPLVTTFDDAMGKNWTASAWPGSNLVLPVTMSGNRLTMVVGTSQDTGDVTPIAFLGITQGFGALNFTVASSPSSLSLTQGTQGSSTITTEISGGFNSAVSLSASGMPSGTTVTFNPTTIPAPGSGTSTMTISVGATTPPGTYPITVTGSGGAIQQETTVSLTVTALQQQTLTVSAMPPALTLVQGTQGSSTITTLGGGGFDSGVTLSAAGMPSGTTVSFNPSTIPAPGSGTSNMTVTVGANTPSGIYPLSVTATGGDLAPTTTVTLTVSSSLGGSGNSIIVFDLTKGGQNNRFVSVGRVFKQSDIPHFAQAVVGQTAILTQCDVKNRWPDGSLKFAIVSFVLPSVTSAGTIVSFQDQSTGNNTGYLQQADMLDPAYDFDATMQLTGAVSPTISARSMLQNGAYRYWLQGPIVTAVIIEDRDNRTADVNTDGGTGNPLHPIFEAWFYPQGHKVEVGFTLENAWSSSTSSQSARNQTYGLTLNTGYASPATRLTQTTFTQWTFTRWRRAFWIDSDPAPIQYNWNPQYLVQTTAYPAYDMNYLPNSSVVSAEYNTYLNNINNYPARLTIPGLDDPNHGGVVNYDQAIGAAGDPSNGSWLGLFPTWDIDYLLTGDPRLQQQMTDNADLAGRFPMWFREADHNAGSGKYFDYPNTGSIDPYGRVVSINSRQQVTLMLADWHPGCRGEATDNINAGSSLSYGGWPSLDMSHLPDFGYIPYTLTGKYYYLEQEQLEGAYVAGFRTGCYDLTNNWWRQGYLGLWELLLRDQAWAVRSLAYAAFISPDGEPEGPYFKDKLLNNLARMEGEHGQPLDISDTNDRNVAYQWGSTTAIYGQASSPSPLNAWDVDLGDYSYAQNGSENNVNPNTLKAAGSMFQEAFMNVALGMTRQMGVANTTELLSWAAKRPFHMLLDPSMNHYLIGQYCYPSEYTNGSWVADWTNFQANYLKLPSQWGAPGTTDDIRGFQQMSGVSFMTDITVDGISGQAVWNWFKSNKPNQSEFQTVDPRWSITPISH